MDRWREAQMQHLEFLLEGGDINEFRIKRPEQLFFFQ